MRKVRVVTVEDVADAVERLSPLRRFVLEVHYGWNGRQPMSMKDGSRVCGMKYERFRFLVNRGRRDILRFLWHRRWCLMRHFENASPDEMKSELTITLVAEGSGPPIEVRWRRALRSLLRKHGLRCLDMRLVTGGQYAKGKPEDGEIKSDVQKNT